MDYKVVAKEGLTIPFKFLRNGTMFDSCKTTLSSAMLKKLMYQGKIELLDADLKAIADAEIESQKKAESEAIAAARAKAVAQTTQTKTKK